MAETQHPGEKLPFPGTGVGTVSPRCAALYEMRVILSGIWLPNPGTYFELLAAGPGIRAAVQAIQKRASG